MLIRFKKKNRFELPLLDNKVLVIEIFYFNHNSNRIYIIEKIVIATHQVLL